METQPPMMRPIGIRGVNNLNADLFWYQDGNGKPDRKRGMHVHEQWFVKVQHTLNDGERYTRATNWDFFRYRLYGGRIQRYRAWWNGLAVKERLEVISITVKALGLVALLPKLVEVIAGLIISLK